MINKFETSGWSVTVLSSSDIKIVKCKDCDGSGFSGQGTGYDSVCDNCGGKGELRV